MFKKFLDIMNMGITYGGKKGGKKAKSGAKKQQQSFHNPFGDAFKDLTKGVNINRMKADEALLILNFTNKEEIPTIQAIEEKFQAFYTMNDAKQEGSVYLQSKVKNARNTLQSELHDQSEFKEVQVTLTEEQENVLEEAFKKHDAEESGLSYETFVKFYNEVYEKVGMQKVSDEEILEMAKVIDKDQTDKISYDVLREFLIDTMNAQKSEEETTEKDSKDEKNENSEKENSKKSEN